MTDTVNFRLHGDTEKAKGLRYFGTKLLSTLQNSMKFNNLKQGRIERCLEDGSVVVCRSIFGTSVVDLFSPVFVTPVKEKVLVKTEEIYDVYYVVCYKDETDIWQYSFLDFNKNIVSTISEDMLGKHPLVFCSGFELQIGDLIYMHPGKLYNPLTGVFLDKELGEGIDYALVENDILYCYSSGEGIKSIKPVLEEGTYIFEETSVTVLGTGGMEENIFFLNTTAVYESPEYEAYLIKLAEWQAGEASARNALDLRTYFIMIAGIYPDPGTITYYGDYSGGNAESSHMPGIGASYSTIVPCDSPAPGKTCGYISFSDYGFGDDSTGAFFTVSYYNYGSPTTQTKVYYYGPRPASVAPGGVYKTIQEINKYNGILGEKKAGRSIAAPPSNILEEWITPTTGNYQEWYTGNFPYWFTITFPFGSFSDGSSNQELRTSESLSVRYSPLGTCCYYRNHMIMGNENYYVYTFDGSIIEDLYVLPVINSEWKGIIDQSILLLSNDTDYYCWYNGDFFHKEELYSLFNVPSTAKEIRSIFYIPNINNDTTIVNL
jgi:hypothetical protein